MSNWNPLETAPVGESVLLAYKMGLGVAIGHKGEDGIWRGHEGTNWGDGKARFSHWMSEPEPPVAANVRAKPTASGGSA